MDQATSNSLFMLLGSKEFEIFQLRQALTAAQEQIKNLIVPEPIKG